MSLDSLVGQTEIIKTERISSDLDDDGKSDTRADRIDESELPYLQQVAAQMDQLPQLEAQRDAIVERIAAIKGAQDSYLLYLLGKYDYDPSTTSIERDGTFTVRG